MNAPAKFGPVIHRDFEQGSERWMQSRCGLLTCSEFDRIITPKTLKIAANEKCSAHLWEMAAQRITQYVEPHYISDDMMRGKEDEIRARAEYSKRYGEIEEVGLITNSRWGFTLGVSPDGLCGDDGMVEAKSRRQKFQVQTIVENVWDGKAETIPVDYMLQCQGALLVAERKWLDFISYSGGLPMVVLRVFPDPAIHDAILEAATHAERRIGEIVEKYQLALETYAPRLTPTERVIEQEMYA